MDSAIKSAAQRSGSYSPPDPIVTNLVRIPIIRQPKAVNIMQRTQYTIGVNPCQESPAEPSAPAGRTSGSQGIMPVSIRSQPACCAPPQGCDILRRKRKNHTFLCQKSAIFWRRRRDLKTSIELFFVQLCLYFPFITQNKNKYNHLVHTDSVAQFF